MDNNPPNRKLLILVILLLAGVLAIFGVIVFSHRGKKQPATANPKASVTLMYTTSDANDAEVRFSGQNIGGSGSPPTYQVAAGNYTLTVKKVGYNDFSVPLHLTLGEVVKVNVALQLATPPTQLKSADQLTIPGPSIPGLTIVSTQLFLSNTWAVLGVQAAGGSDTAIVVAHFDAASRSWLTDLGPGTIFSTGDLETLPIVVQQYLNQNNYVNSGSQQ